MGEACQKEMEGLRAAWSELDGLKIEKTQAKDGRASQLAGEVGTLFNKKGAETSAQQALENYGNCAQKIAEYNAAIDAKRTDIEGLNTVINFLQTIPDDAESAIGF